MHQQDSLQTGPSDVAQIFNLLYRRLAVCGRRNTPAPQWFPGLADCKSAIQQIENLRYTSGAGLSLMPTSA